MQLRWSNLLCRIGRKNCSIFMQCTSSNGCWKKAAYITQPFTNVIVFSFDRNLPLILDQEGKSNSTINTSLNIVTGKYSEVTMGACFSRCWISVQDSRNHLFRGSKKEHLFTDTAQHARCRDADQMLQHMAMTSSSFDCRLNLRSQLWNFL
jgi:hypothetical protein